MAEHETNQEAGHDKKPYKLMIDQKSYEWPEQFITGAQIKKLAGVDVSFGVWQQLPGPNDPEIADQEKVDLGEPGKERFFTGKKTTTEGRSSSVRPS